MRKLKFPEVFNELKLNRKLTSLELTKIKEGSQPNHMDDKWVIYFEDPWLYFHRFLTGICFYKVRITCRESNCEIDKVMINGDPELYNFHKQDGMELFLEIFDLFLQGKIK
jgi:hypothetical protein